MAKFNPGDIVESGRNVDVIADFRAGDVDDDLRLLLLEERNLLGEEPGVTFPAKNEDVQDNQQERKGKRHRPREPRPPFHQGAAHRTVPCRPMAAG